MEQKRPEPVKLSLSDIPSKFHMLAFLVKKEVNKVSKEMELSLQAGEIVGKLYDAFQKQYKDPDDPETLKSLNKLCVRIVFLLYGEDAGILGKKNIFHDYMEQFSPSQARKGLRDLFRVLNQDVEDRDPYLADDDPLLAEFPYVNGGLFEDDDIEIPPFTEEIMELLLRKASDDFDWSGISPTIFGAVFESTLNPETRRSGGMHYTSIENIHKVIDPLFLDELKAELAEIRGNDVWKTKEKKLKAFQDKLASLSFLDPAAGSGNFLTESYLSLRKLENEVILLLTGGQISFGEAINPIKVSIRQFYGIEINDFAVTVARTALWIAEDQMMKQTEDIVHMDLDFLPLKTNASIIEGNALRIDWNDVVPKEKLNYIMGNPPFIGSARLSDSQKIDRDKIFLHSGGELDYVSCWYKKTFEYVKNTFIRSAFVSTNSICQGQQVEPLWHDLMEEGLVINFAYRTFVWDSEASVKAHVYCIIIGFSCQKHNNPFIYEIDGSLKEVSHINGYLMDAPNIYVTKRRVPLCDVPSVIKGIQPTDNGFLVLSEEEKNELLVIEPQAQRWIRPFITAREFINGKNRWCLWLVGISPADLRKMPHVLNRVNQCGEWRRNQKQTGDAYKLKDSPYLMRPSKKFREGTFIVIPRHTGERRRYIPFGFAMSGSIPGDSISLIPSAELYQFGVLSSNVHMAWVRSVCGRLKGDYRYSSDIVYNNFIWPEFSEQTKNIIHNTAQAILDARGLYPDASLADLYDPLTMPPELLKAHRANDRAVMEAYGMPIKETDEAACVAWLMRLYQEKTQESS